MLPAQSVGSLQEELTELIFRLIAFRSTRNRPEALAACAGFIAGWLREHSLMHRVFDSNGIPSILVGESLYKSGSVPPKALLLAHFDVVEGADHQFSPRLKGNELYGRGSVDDKYAVALSLLLYRELAAARPDFMLLFTGDEEVGGADGAGFVCERVLPRLGKMPEFCLALDGGSPAEIITRQKGVLRLALLEEGKAAHGARPWLGDNAAVKLAGDCIKVTEMFKHIEKQYSGSPEYWHPTCNIGMIRSGEVVNQVPDHARADFDVRYTEKQNPEQLVQSIGAALEGRLELVASIPPLTPLPSPRLDALFRCANKKRKTSITVGHGASDAQFFSRNNIPCAVWGAEGNASQHGSDEHLCLDSAMDIMEVLADFLNTL
ncbi:MAG: M20 family metallopeptidase [Deltaproteobacteria bacterium]|nr:M20 family metallopeptidase [Deltaproteobacteria bacterium]